MHIAKASPTATIPRKATEGSAGWDLHADLGGENNVVRIRPNETVMVSSGIILDIPEGCFAGLYNRSGLSTKRHLMLANNTAVIDSDYTGVIQVPLWNRGTTDVIIEHGDRIAQLIVQPYLWKLELEEVESIEKKGGRGSGGFGSTGRK